MRVITFSRVFPKKHPREGQPTFFAEKVMASLADTVNEWKMPAHFVLYDWHEYYNARPKHHTIRAGERWKQGDWFSPRIWTDKPYASKQAEFSAPIQIKKVWSFEANADGYFLDGKELKTIKDLEPIANNDGLSVDDFECWFSIHPKKVKTFFKGQVLCWNEKLNY